MSNPQKLPNNFIQISPIKGETEPKILQEFRMALDNVKDFKSGKRNQKSLMKF